MNDIPTMVTIKEASVKTGLSYDLARVEILVSNAARQYYNRFVSEYEKEYDEQIKQVAKHYTKQLKDQFEDKERKARNDRDTRRKYEFTGLPQDW